jgi:hypothetical protein
MSDAIRQVVDASVSIVARDSPPPDDEALVLGNRMGAAAVAEVSWQPEEQPTALLHVYLVRNHRWVNQTIHFDRADLTSERSRAIGFAVASMLPELARPAPAPPEVPAAPPAVSARALPVPVAEPGPRAWIGAFDGGVAVANALGGYGGGYGGAIGASWILAPRWAVRLGLAARVGEIEPASATSNSEIASLGLRYGPFATRQSRLGWGLRLDASLMRYELVHLSYDDPEPDHRVQLMPSAAATAEGSVALTDGAEAVLGVGVEAAPRGDVFTHNQKVASLAPFRGLASFGFRARF